MKRTYSGFEDGRVNTPAPKPRSSSRQILPILLPVVAIMLMVLLRGVLPGQNGEGAQTEGAGGIVFYYAAESGGGFIQRASVYAPEEGAGILYLLEKGFKEPPEGCLRTINANVYIGEISTNGRHAAVDFSSEPVPPEGGEARLYAAAKTIGGFFNVNEVIFTLRGEAYRTITISQED